MDNSKVYSWTPIFQCNASAAAVLALDARVPNSNTIRVRLASSCAYASPKSMKSSHFAPGPTAMRQRLSIWFARGAQVILPNHCALCGNLSHQAVCSSCDSAAAHTVSRCACCAAALGKTGSPRLCGNCIATRPAFDATLAYADYASPYDALAQALKFSAKLGLARWFAARMATRVKAAEIAPDLILTVPLSAQRLAERGYNQSWEIARPLARHLGVAAHGSLLRRLHHTRPQTDLSDARQRRHNVRGAFVVSACAATRTLNGAHVAVVDDVMTSGATLNEIARLLKRAGAARVTNLVALRTPPPADAAHPRHPPTTSQPASWPYV